MSRLLGVRALSVFLALTLAPSLARAADFSAGDLVIQHPWMRATPNGAQVAGGYLSITNHGTEADTLTGGSIDGAAQATIHNMTMDGGVMRMRPSGPLSIHPGGSITLSPSGTHIMFTQLRHGFRKGDVIAGTLDFQRAGRVPIRFTVEGIGAKAPTAGASPDMPGMKMD